MQLERLIVEAQRGREDAEDELLRRSRSIINNVLSYYHINSEERADIESLALAHFLVALRTYRRGAGSGWPQWLSLLLRRRVCLHIRHIRRASRIPYDATTDGVEDIASPDADPADIVAARLDGDAARAIRELRAACSPLEWACLVAVRFEQRTQSSVAADMSIDIKRVNNALGRVRRKALALGLDELTSGN